MILFKNLFLILKSPKIFIYTIIWMMVLVIIGTLAQRNMGLFSVQEKYFSSWFFTVLYFPVPGLKNGDSTRLSLFLDAGQVFGHGDSLSFSDLRLSAGLAFNWFTAIGPLAVSYGIPINAMTDDKTKRLQITFGTLFR